MSRTITKLTPAIGAEIVGLAGHDFVDQAVADEALALLEEHGVLVYRGAHLVDDDLVAFSRMLGDVVVSAYGAEKDHPEITAITLDPAKSKLVAYRKGTFFWHIDGAQDVMPQKATLLAAHEVADEGGDTEFASTYAAYDALSDAERDELADLRVIHSFSATQVLVYPDPTPEQRAAWEQVPDREHPLVWTRPSGRKSLLVGATTASIVGRSPEEGRALLDRLLAWSTRPEFVLRHHWNRGDLVIWDNTGLLHRAIPYEPTSPRLMHRTTLTGEYAVA